MLLYDAGRQYEQHSEYDTHIKRTLRNSKQFKLQDAVL